MPVIVPQGVNAGIAVFDRQSGSYLTQVNATGRFRSASLVKILIALDFLLARGPDYAISASDRAQLELMLRGSDDKAASYFYQRIGGEPGIKRMITLMALENTAPPSAVGLNGWGSTTLSANDMVRVYRYLLEQSPAPVRELIMGNLRQSTPCGTDAYHQTFGIPLAFPRPWTAKQGWWGFGDSPPIRCTAQTPPPAVPSAAPAIRGAKPALMSGRVLHTTGTVGEGDRFIVAVLTQYPSGTAFTDAFATITALTRTLPVSVPS
ncbi:lipoprotein [Rhizocola hellebori]|uniref:Lipoprotein n=2 Tax=Rhizocola hellebori TaxID=1392758 RepID=A0A8J3QG07_9ACTN|nr:lipoprotein [Rhizocola hellebori]